MNDIVAEVVLPVPPGTPFYYKVPENLINKCKIGRRVIVPYGKKVYTGIVFKILEKKRFDFELKNIISVIDDNDFLTGKQLEIFNWLKEYYFISHGEILNYAIPSGLLPENEILISLNEDIEFEDLSLSARELEILYFLKKNKRLNFRDLKKKIKSGSLLKDICSLREKNVVFLNNFLNESKGKTLKFVRLKNLNESKFDKIFDLLKKSKKQQQVVIDLIDLHFKGIDEIELKEILSRINVNYDILRKLKEKEIIEIINKPLYPYKPKIKKLILNQNEEILKENILRSFTTKDVLILQTTFSQVESVLYSIIADYVEKNKEVILLFPEIHQVKKIYNRLKYLFENIVAEYHSEVSDSQKITIWQNLLDDNIDDSNKYKIFIGIRTVLFLPIHKPGLILVFSEHKESYKDQYSLCLNFKDIAILLSKIYNIKVILIDTAPSFESYYNAITDKFGFLRMLSDKKKNEFIIVDIRKLYYKKKLHLYFSDILIENIEKNLNEGRKIVLIQNRKGFASYVQCSVCGYVKKCKNCDLTLVYHKDINKLVCHYCGYKEIVTSYCPICLNNSLLIKGFGTERIEEDVSILFPNKKILRIDSETISLTSNRNEILKKVDEDDYDIIIATQVFINFIDYLVNKNVGCLAFIDFDKFLNIPDFRSYEKAFQLISEIYFNFENIKILIQTNDADNVFYKFLKNFSYENFFRYFIEERKEFLYPPFTRLLRIELSHKNKNLLIKAGEKLRNLLNDTDFKGSLNFNFSNDFINKYNQYYFLNFLIKLRKDKTLYDNKRKIQHCIENTLQYCKSVKVKIDVDPL